MRRLFLTSMLLITLSVACGDGGPGDGASAPDPTLDLTPIDPESLRFTEWELFPVTGPVHPYVWGRVVDEEGQPVAGAAATEIRLCLAPELAPLRGRSVSTNEDGVFRLDSFPGNGMVLIEKEGRGGRLVPIPELLPTRTEPRDLALRPAGAVHGVVRLPGGLPVANYPILLFTPSWDWVADTETDAEGAYRVADVPEGDLVINATSGPVRGEPAPGVVVANEDCRVDLTLSRTPLLNGRVLDKASGKPLKTALVRTMVHREEVFPVDEDGAFRIEGAHSSVMFVLADGYGEIGWSLDPTRTEADRAEIRLEPGARIYGRVVDDRGEPMGGVRLEAMINPVMGGPIVRGPLSAPDGSFAFTWISLPPEGAPVILLARSTDDHYGHKMLGHLDQREFLEDVELEFTRPASVRFRVVDNHGEPWRLATVRLEKDMSGLPGRLALTMRPESRGIADSEGNTHLTGLYGSTHHLIVMPPGRIPWLSAMDIEPGSDLTLGDIVVPRGLAIRGRIESTGGDIHDAHEYFVTREGANWLAPLEIDENGNFELEGLEEGEYLLSAGLLNHDRVQMKVRGGQHDIRVRLRAQCFLTVKVNHPEGERIDADIEAVRMGPTHQLGKPTSMQLPSAEDEVEFPPLAAGRYFIRLDAGNWVARKEILLEPGDRATVELEPEQAASVTGTVLHADGRRAIGVGVECNAGKSWGVEGVTTEDQGGFQFAGLPEGRVAVKCHPYGYPPAVAEIDLVAGKMSEVILQLTPGAGIEIEVVDENEQPLPKVKVVLSRVDGEDARFWLKGSETGVSGPDGRLTYIGVQPGRHTMRVYVSGEEEPRERRTIDLVDGGTEKIRFQFDK